MIEPGTYVGIRGYMGTGLLLVSIDSPLRRKKLVTLKFGVLEAESRSSNKRNRLSAVELLGEPLSPKPQLVTSRENAHAPCRPERKFSKNRAARGKFCIPHTADDKRSRRRLPVNKHRPDNGYGGQVHDGEGCPRGCPSAGATEGSVVAILSRGDSLSSHGRLNMN